MSRFAFFTAAFLFLLLLSCEKKVEQHEEALAYKSFLDIPGITASEIEAVEAFKAKNTSFVYGMLLNIESFNGENDEIKGYAALLCNYLTELLGISFKPAIYKWDDLLSGLADGSIDFTGELTANDERRKTYYMTDAIAERTVKSFRLKDAEPISQIIASRLPRYGFLNGSITLSMVSLLSDHEFEPSIVPNHNAVHDALVSGQIDAFLDENGVEAIFDAYDDVVSIDFLPLIYNSVSLTTQKQELEPIISIVQKMLQSGHISYLIKLYENGYQEYVKSKLARSFSEEEREYIRKTPVVSFAAEFDNYPVSFYNKHENQWQGVAFDALEEVKKLTGLSFKAANAPGTEWLDLLKMLEEGNVSMVTELIRSKDRESRFLWSETSLMQNRYALISKLEHPDINVNDVLRMKVGLTKGSAYAELFKIWFPSHSNAMEFESTEQTLYALKTGEIDMFMTSQKMLLTMTNYMEQPGYKVNILFDRTFESLLGFNKDERILSSILEKTLKLVNINRINDRWAHKTYDYRIKLAESQFLWLVCAAVLFFCVIVLLFVLYKRIQNEEKWLEGLVQRRTAELSEQRKLLEYMSLTDQLTGLPNRRNFDMRLDLGWRMAIREKQPISFFMLDIDDFKTYNDSYGHQQGDQVLRMIAKTIERTLKRPGDFAARWGGEEFAVLLYNTGTNGALKIAESIRANVENIKMPMPNGSLAQLTVSVGINTQAPVHGDSLESFISIADKELYKAKEAGKNRVSCFS
jgi:diguanylate cyclase (GGDEF)-like protein